MMSTRIQGDHLRDALVAGVTGFLLKPFSIIDLCHVVVGVMCDQVVLSETLKVSLLDLIERDRNDGNTPPHLSPQEQRIIVLVAAGLTDLAIGMELGVSENTVKTHLKRIYQKAGARCRAEAVAIWCQSRSPTDAERCAESPP